MGNTNLAEKYRNVSLPKELLQEIEKIVKNKRHGYMSNAEFVKEAVREHLRKIKKEPL